MANNIYILTTSSFNEDFILDAYATSIDEAVEIAKGYYSENMYPRGEVRGSVKQVGKDTIIVVKDDGDEYDATQEFRVVSIPRFSPDIFSAN
jgi:hypothetical protein